MIPRDAEPVSHQPVYKRVSIGSDAERPKPETKVIRTPCEEAAHHVKMQEVNRIWKLVVQTAHGTTAPSPVELEVLPVDGIDPYYAADIAPYLPEEDISLEDLELTLSTYTKIVSLEDLDLISFAKLGGPV